MSAPPLTQISVGVVVERRKAESPWIDFTWRPVTALPGAPVVAPWTQLFDRRRHGGVLCRRPPRSRSTVPNRALSRQSRLRFAGPVVALRPTNAEPPFDLVAVTADPAEGEGFTQNGDHLVEPVPMPEPVRVIVEAFVAEHHVEQPFVKRKRDRADPEALARRGPPPKDRPR